ncbi:flagellar biosynthesis regulator FlaF [Falsiroseomonas oryzae]|uniref:flagellar biosynthesis regulator FlaF n=1 Tax=Falsiroseomonas oryzae TaxID=2766473 RepID=UPI0022EB9178|nr:flagellar biosynthesis regulator FlaF [Roseomonas sp. MO-31]
MGVARYAAAQNAASSPKELELRAFRYVNGLLAGAGDVPARATALQKTAQLWSILVGDLTLDSNGLPDELKGRLISLGIWAQREAAARMMDDASLQPLIALHRDMIAGLEAQAASLPRLPALAGGAA